MISHKLLHSRMMTTIAWMLNKGHTITHGIKVKQTTRNSEKGSKNTNFGDDDSTDSSTAAAHLFDYFYYTVVRFNLMTETTS